MNYYEALDVARDASPEQIRLAYVTAAKLVHPDRIDQQKEPERWAYANERMKSLNEVYGVLGDEGSRRDYDAFLRGERPYRPAPQATPPPIDLGEMSSGDTSMGNLSRAMQERLIRRVRTDELDGFRVRQGVRHWAWIGLLVAGVSFGCLLIQIGSPPWEIASIWIAAFWSALGALSLGLTLEGFYRRGKYPLGRHLLFTPLYIIRTKYDKISYWPLWLLRDFQAVNHSKNGGYSHTSVSMEVEGTKLNWKMSNHAEFVTMVATISRFRDERVAAQQRADWAYFFANDDFRDRPAPPTRAPRWGPRSWYLAASAVFAALVLLGCYVGNRSYSARSRTATTTLGTERGALPASGDAVTYVRTPATVPVEIIAPADHDCLVSFLRPEDDSVICAVYVRSGESANVMIPAGAYRLERVTGDQWKNYTSLFGAATVRRVAAQVINAKEGGNHLVVKADQSLFGPS